MEALNLDAHLENADWTKQSWDLPFDPEDLDSEEAQAFFRSSGITREQFERLPVYQHYLRRRAAGAG